MLLLGLGAGLAGLLSLAMLLAWQLAWRTGRSGLIDAIWSLSTCLAGVIAALAPGGLVGRRALVGAMAGMWGLRLGTYLLARARGAEDPRYAKLKAEWGKQAGGRLLRFLQAQALAAWPLVLAIGLAAHATRPRLDLRDAAGAAILLLALAGEALADRQMARFRSAPANHGKICDTGLWRWSRHPNYFCEWLVWLGFVVIAAGGWGWLSLLAPALMYHLLVNVSGLPPLEAHLASSRPEAFAAYCTRVSAFWPRPPRSL